MNLPPAHYDSGDYSFQSIAVIRSCYPERFGIPRQAGLVPTATARIEFENNEDNRLALRGIADFSHLWVLFVFHRQAYRSWKPLVNPPRLGGNQSVGLYATRSPNRRNPIGMSAVELSHVEMTNQAIALHIRGGDFLDRTPVLDLKPYVVYADAISHANSAWAKEPEAPMEVVWSHDATATLGVNRSELKQLITESIALDPRPGYERHKDGKPGEQWYMTIENVDVAWKVEQGIATITQLRMSASSSAKRIGSHEGLD